MKSLPLLPVLLASVASAVMAFAFAAPASAQTVVGDLCRVKGQEENVLHGMGLVVGLEGTGDADVESTQRALAQYMSLMNHPLPKDPTGQSVVSELKNAKNVALVFVTARIPGAGARQGDKLVCNVSAVSAKSLRGGELMLCPLRGPNPADDRVYALAQGKIQLDRDDQLRTGTIAGGCQLEVSPVNQFLKENKATLVLHQEHAAFAIAAEIAETINNAPDFRYAGEGESIATAKDSVSIEIAVPDKYLDDPVLFLGQILNLRMTNVPSEARVVINERTEVIVVGADVRVGPVAVTHGDLAVSTSNFVAVDPQNGAYEPAKLADLVDALNQVKATKREMIDIIKELHRSGKLYGRLIVE
jgi:flagellar P-ring protein precursor FlgI